MSVALSPQIENRIRDLVEGGRYPSASAVIERALDALDAQDAKFAELREQILLGFQGEGAELTESLMDEIEREAEEAFLRGEEPPAHVRP
jgi:putative addiction module CopG family antidote